MIVVQVKEGENIERALKKSVYVQKLRREEE